MTYTLHNTLKGKPTHSPNDTFVIVSARALISSNVAFCKINQQQIIKQTKANTNKVSPIVPLKINT